jgi:ribosomal-protein-alanine N-acetyltransferase
VSRVGPEAGAALAALHDAARAPNERAWTDEEFAALAGAPGAFAFTAAADGIVGGFILGWVHGDDGEVHLVAVTPAQRRKGMARALVAAAEHAAQVAGARRMVLEVASDNAPARALYQRCGYAQIAVRPGYYASGADALVLARSLVPGHGRT